MSEDAEGKKEALAQKILDAARAEAKKLIERAGREADEILAAAERSGRKEAEDILRNAQARAMHEAGRITATIPLMQRQKVLASEDEALDSMFALGMRAAVEAAAKMPEQVLKAFILGAALLIPEDGLVVQANANDLPRISSAMLAEVASEVKKRQGRSVAITRSDQPVEILGGAIVSGVSGRVLCDNSFEARLRRSREDLRLKLAKILFAGLEV